MSICLGRARYLFVIYAYTGPAIAIDLKAQAEESDRKTDNLPTFKDIGASLNNKFGQTDPKDVGKAVEQNTPGKPVLNEELRGSLWEMAYIVSAVLGTSPEPCFVIPMAALAAYKGWVSNAAFDFQNACEHIAFAIHALCCCIPKAVSGMQIESCPRQCLEPSSAAFNSFAISWARRSWQCSPADQECKARSTSRAASG